MVEQGDIEIHTDPRHLVTDITAQVQAVLDRGRVRRGTVLIFIAGATGALSTIEFEPGLQRDLPELMERLIPRGADYHHNRTWKDGNGHSHLQATLMGPSLTVPLRDGRLALGTWQQIVFLEFDNRSRNRRILVQVMGEAD